MKFAIKHEIKGRIRIHVLQKRMTYSQADTLLYYLQSSKLVRKAKVYENTQDAAIEYRGSRAGILELLRKFSYETVEVPDGVLETSSRALNAEYKEKLIMKFVWRAFKQLFVPQPIRIALTLFKSVKYIWRGIKKLAKGRIEVEVLDATAIAISIIRSDFTTAGSVMFLLGIGELLEEWTHKKSVDDLARSMSLNISKVWLQSDSGQVLVPVTDIQSGDRVIVHMGNVIPFDGVVVSGEAMVNQSSLTGESIPAGKETGSIVYAGTVVEEGEIILQVSQSGKTSRFEKIVSMIEETEKLKSASESKAERLADRLVPYTLAGTALTWLFTRNVTKALAVLMVDFSCALKLAMPIAVLSAIKEAGDYHITVKGGKFLEAVAEADTIVFDKTGTLTEAKPTVAKVIAFNGETQEDLLRLAACMEEHFPHSIANAVVRAAEDLGLEHKEMHTKVEYIVAHGITTWIEGKRAVIGSYHFVFQDEKSVIPPGKEQLFENLPEEYSHLYLAIEGKLAGVICIEDPLREEAADVIAALKAAGIGKIVMMTGDSERTACAIAQHVGVDEYYSEVLPEDKARFVEQEKSQGRRVVMIGDGVNDSPALSAADVGIAISDGAEIAREIADVTISADNLAEIVNLKKLSDSLMKRIRKNYRYIVGINTGLIVFGVTGIMQPTTTAMLHNISTLAISLKSMQSLLAENAVEETN